MRYGLSTKAQMRRKPSEMTQRTDTEKARVTFRMDAEDFEYIRKIFAVQGYNAGLRWLVTTFIKIHKAKEAQHAAGIPGAIKPTGESVLAEIGVGKPGGPDGEGPASAG